MIPNIKGAIHQAVIYADIEDFSRNGTSVYISGQLESCLMATTTAEQVIRNLRSINPDDPAADYATVHRVLCAMAAGGQK